MMTRKEVFEKVKNHLLAQMEVSLTDGSEAGGGAPMCAYRGRNGLKCAIGCLIPDEKYSQKLEGISISRVSSATLLSALDGEVPTDRDTITMLYFLQGIHDGDHPRDWARKLDTLELLTAFEGP